MENGRKATYEPYVLGPIPRFEQKNTAFCRATWDKEIMQRKKLEEKIRQTKMAKGVSGFTQLDVAFQASSWYVEHTSGRSASFQGDFGLLSWESQDQANARIRERKVELDPEKASNLVKYVAKFFGADLVGVTKLNRTWLYSSIYERSTGISTDLDSLISNDYKYAVAMAIEMDYEALKVSPAALAGAAIGTGYSYMPVVAAMLAEYIRCLGYRAIPMGNDTALSIPIAIDAGLGELGRNGLLITPEFGPRVRLCKVITDMPLEPDEPIDFGVQKFCEVCKKCARRCPSKAITGGDRVEWRDELSNNRGLLKWVVDPKKCYLFWLANGIDCSNCISSCPFNKPSSPVHALARWSIKNLPFLDSFLVWVDDSLGYGKHSDPSKLWEHVLRE